MLLSQWRQRLIMLPHRLKQLFERHTRLYHFWMQDLRNGEVVELGTRHRYPIGSCFKLAVLMAYFDQLTDPEQLDRPVVIPVDRFRIGGGVINFLDSDTTLTERQMLHFMLAASDGTCTDWLIELLGLSRVNAVLTQYGAESVLATNLGDMVARFRDIPPGLACKHHEFTTEALLGFNMAVSELGHTTSEDLANLAEAAWNYSKTTEWRSDYDRCLRVRRGVQRTEMFIDPAVRCFTKTGSLGLRFFMQDCGVLSDPTSGDSIAKCRVPDEYLVHTRRPLLMGREVLKATLAHWSEIREC